MCSSGIHPGAKSFSTAPQTLSYIAWAPDLIIMNAKFIRDNIDFCIIISGKVLCNGLNLGVFGAGLGPDDPGCPETHSND